MTRHESFGVDHIPSHVGHDSRGALRFECDRVGAIVYDSESLIAEVEVPKTALPSARVPYEETRDAVRGSGLPWNSHVAK
jgi:hypothetical protein